MHLWWVRHPECGLAIVDAPNWEQATVEAANWWEVSWREVAALCECEREEIVPGMCVSAAGKYSTAKDSAAPNVRSSNGTSGSIKGPGRGGITAA